MSDQMMQGKSIRHSCSLTQEEKTIVEYFRQLDAYGRAEVIATSLNEIDRITGGSAYKRYGIKQKPIFGKIVEFEAMRFPNGRRASK